MSALFAFSSFIFTRKEAPFTAPVTFTVNHFITYSGEDLLSEISFVARLLEATMSDEGWESRHTKLELFKSSAEPGTPQYAAEVLAMGLSFDTPVAGGFDVDGRLNIFRDSLPPAFAAIVDRLAALRQNPDVDYPDESTPYPIFH